MKAISLNKLTDKRKVKCLEIPNYAEPQPLKPKLITRYIYILPAAFLTACGTALANKIVAVIDSAKVETTIGLQTNVATGNKLTENTTGYNL